MQNVDALSRANSLQILKGNTIEQTLAVKQSTDDGILKLKETLENSEDPFYELRNGLVYRKANNDILFYVPESMEFTIIHKYHNEIGHFALVKTFENITRIYWFPKMRIKIKNHIATCLKCIEFNLKGGEAEGYLHNIPKGNFPFETIHIDHLSPGTVINIHWKSLMGSLNLSNLTHANQQI